MSHNFDPNNLDLNAHRKETAESCESQWRFVQDEVCFYNHEDEEYQRRKDLEMMDDFLLVEKEHVRKWFQLAKDIGIDKATEYFEKWFVRSRSAIEELWADQNDLKRCGDCYEYFDSSDIRYSRSQKDYICDDCRG